MSSCPRCGSPETTVYLTVRHATTTERTRQCRACGVRFVTLETETFVRFVRPYTRKSHHGHTQ